MQTRRYTETHMYRNTYIQIYRHADTQIYIYTETQTCRHTDMQTHMTHRHAATQIFRYTGTQTHRPAHQWTRHYSILDIIGLDAHCKDRTRTPTGYFTRLCRETIYVFFSAFVDVKCISTPKLNRIDLSSICN
jgi:hypothetical protein